MLRFNSLLLCAAKIPKVKGITVTKAGAIATITLDRPRQRNAISYDMYKHMIDCFYNFSADPEVKAIILTGNGDYYCSGNDLKNFFSFGHPRTLSANAKEICGEFVMSFVECEKPIVVGINGPAIGIAVTTLMLCDHRICVPEATFNTPFKALAQGPEGCSSYLFPKVLGKDLAKKMLVDGYTMKADEALKHEFVHEVVPRSDLSARCQEVAMEIASGKRTSDRYTLREKSLLADVNKAELDYLEEAWVSKECFEALEKFMASKGNKKGAFLFKTLNATRFLWDRK